LLAGCNNFFVCEGKASCPSTGGSTTSTTDFVYISNSASGSTDLAAYDLTSGALTAISGSPFNISFQPVALNVSPNNEFLYAATLPGVTNPGIYLFTIASDGALSAANSGNAVISAQVASMAISPDGGYLFAVNSDGTTMSEYQINSSTGFLTLATTLSFPLTTCTLAGTPVSQTCSVTVAPSGQFVVVALGTAGDAIFPYSSSTGISSASYTLIPSGTTTGSPTGDYSVVLDSNNYVYIARTSALAVFQITDTSGDAVQKSSTAYSSGVTPRSLALNSTQNYVYTANEGNGTISAWGIGSGGALTAASGSPFTGPSNVSAIGIDNTGNYMIAAGYNASTGVQLFSVGSTGSLTLITSAATGTSTAYPVVLAMSH
jgi:6-phosphogluconolactonase (cycloisomerase 2 family)